MEKKTDMTEWDQIYKDYQKGGEAWATLDEKKLPEFVQFVERTTFSKKSALDIGCGTGNYLQYLQQRDFQVAGIDSSETAIAMTRERLGKDVSVTEANMFEYKIPHDRFDFIYSISTIHHGRKEQVANVWHQIHEALLPDGKIFSNIPNHAQFGVWHTFKNRKEIAPGTFIPLDGPEKGLPHSFFTEREVRELLQSFQSVTIGDDTHGRWIVSATK